MKRNGLVSISTADAVKKLHDFPVLFHLLGGEKNNLITIPDTILSADQGYTSNPIGPVGFIHMLEGSAIVMESGSQLHVRGYITGSGTIDAKSGAKVYENFQLKDWRGGTATSDMTGSSNTGTYHVLPMSQYFLQNIEVALTYESGAAAYATMAAYVTLVGVVYSEVPVIGDTGMFRLTSGTLVKDFEESTGRTEFTLKGEMSVSKLSLSMKLSVLGNSTIDTENYVLPIPGHITIDVQDGSEIRLDQNVALLPGCELYIRKGAICKLVSGKSIVVYDLDNWGPYCGHLNQDFSDMPYAPGRAEGVDANRRKDALVQVDGYVDASDGYVYTTAGGANIYGTGCVVTKPGSDTKTYQASQGGSEGKDVSYVPIAIRPAVLQNANNTITDTALKQGVTTYYWNTACQMWTTNENTTQHASDHICPDCGEQASDCFDNPEDGDHVCNYVDCNVVLNACVDSNKDHICDNDSKCDAFATDSYAHKDSDGDGDHVCDHCGETLTTCEDKDTNHKCDECGAEMNMEKHVDADGDGNHLCDYGCGATLTECKDNDFNHNCDECAEELTTHLDDNRDHICDFTGCNKRYTDCVDVAPVDHICDYENCGERMGVHGDQDRDHVCDYGCSEPIGECADQDGDGNHVCDYGCGKAWSECVDSDKDHGCDNDSACSAYSTGDNVCADADNDGDHVCDYGCGKVLTTCGDSQPDHVCDTDSACNAYSTGDNACVDADNDGDHVCDYGCGKVLNICGDSQLDHVCDTDSACDVYSTGDNVCADADNDGDHVCDYGCGKVWSECVDSDKDHICDNDSACNVYSTGDNVCADADNDGDHICDYGCGKVLNICGDSQLDHVCDTDSTCNVYSTGDNTCADLDNDGDHVCDYGCGKVLTTCGDEDINHVCDSDSKCDVYSTGVNEHRDTDLDHVCEYGCSESIGVCADADQDHYCDYGSKHDDGCRKWFGEHKDSFTDGDHICDYCQNENDVLEECEDCAWNYFDNADGSHDAFCAVCNAQMLDGELHIYNVNGACVCGNTAEAKIGETYYCFFADAVAAAKDGQLVIMCKDVTLSEKLTLRVSRFGTWATTP